MMDDFARVLHGLDPKGPCEPAATVIRLAGYGTDWRKAWFDCGHVEWMKWGLDKLGVRYPLAATTCDEIRAFVPFEAFAEAVRRAGGTVED